jgi:hypothetical protein
MWQGQREKETFLVPHAGNENKDSFVMFYEAEEKKCSGIHYSITIVHQKKKILRTGWVVG